MSTHAKQKAEIAPSPFERDAAEAYPAVSFIANFVRSADHKCSIAELET